MKEVTVKALVMDNKMTKMMQACDLFEKSRVIIKTILTISYRNNFLKRNLNILKKSLQEKGYDVIAVFDCKKIHYQNPDIKVVSNGKMWAKLDEFIQYEMNK